MAIIIEIDHFKLMRKMREWFAHISDDWILIRHIFLFLQHDETHRATENIYWDIGCASNISDETLIWLFCRKRTLAGAGAHIFFSVITRITQSQARKSSIGTTKPNSNEIGQSDNSIKI